MIAEITIPGRAYTKKNSQNVFAVKAEIANADSKSRVYCPRCHSKLKILFNLMQSKQYRQYEEECLWRLKSYRGPKFTSNVRVTCVYWMPSYQSWPDLMGLYQATADILQKAGIIKNDRDIVSFDGSRIAGIDSGNPRVEIEIEGGVIE